jgi:hypothetical protein
MAGVCRLRRPRLRIAILLLPTLVLIISGLAAPSFGSLQQVGVSVGDWVKYKVIMEGNSSAAWAEEWDVEWIRIEVLNITDTTVELIESRYYENGGVRNSTMTIDTTKPRHYGYVIPANLTLEDDGIFDKDFRLQINETAKISQTTMKNYTGATREVCFFELSYAIPYFEDTLNCSEKFWWDRKTGFMLEVTYESFIERAPRESGSTQTIIVTETSLWETLSQPSDSLVFLRWGISGTVLMLGVGAAALSIRRGRLKNDQKNIDSP